MKKLILAAMAAFLLLGFYFYSKSESAVEKKMRLFLSTGANPVEVKKWLKNNQYSIYTYSQSDLSSDYISDIKEPGLDVGSIGTALSASSKDYYDIPPFRRGARLVIIFDKSMKMSHYKLYE